ncbi:MAG: PAS domain S-box protein [Burkholderiales bacterium]
MLTCHHSALSVPVEVINRIDQGIILADADGRVQFVNAAFSDLAGLNLENLTGLAAEDVFAPAYRTKLKEQRQQRQAGQTATYESSLISARGSELAVSITESPQWKDGKCVGSVMIVTLVAQCRIGQGALPDSEVSFSKVADSSLSGFVVHRDGEIIYVNPTALRQFGVDNARDMVGRSLIAFIAPSSRAFAALCIHPAAHAVAALPVAEIQGLRPDGTVFDLAVQSIHITYEGEPATCTSIRNIRQCQQAETALRQAEERLRLAHEAMIGVVYDQDIATGTIWWSDRVTQLYGWDDPAMLSSPTVWRKCLHPDDCDRVIGDFGCVSATSANTYSGRYRLLRKDGQYAHVEERCCLVRAEDGGVIRIVWVLQDVTEHRLAELATNRNLQDLRLILNKTGGLFARLDRDLRFTFMNDRYVDVFGKPLSESLGRSLLEFHGEEFFARMVPYVTRMFTGETVTFENYFESPIGRRYGLCSLIPDRDESGVIVGCFAVVVDITRIKRTEAKLIASEERFKFAINATEEGLWDWNITTGDLFLAPQWARLLGYEDGVVQQELSFLLSIIHPDYVSVHRESLEAHLAGMTRVMYTELRLRTKSGEYRWFANRGRIVATDEMGKPTRMVGTISDISAQKKAGVALRESEERYRGLVEWSPDPAIVHRSGKLIYVNRAFVNLIGARSVDEAMQCSLLDIVAPEFHALVIERMHMLASGAEFAPLMEMRGIRLDGKDIFVETHGRRVSYDGLPASHVTIRDISDRKFAERARAELESQLREAQKMQAIGTLAGGIAHDFNNILTIILGNVDLAREDAKDNAREQESLEEIRRAATRARDLVKQILSFSRRQPTDLKPTPLRPVVDEAARLLRSTLPARLSLTTQVEADLPPVMADSTQIQQVIINLCTNAMQAIDRQGGAIEISVESIVLDDSLASTHPDLAALKQKQHGPMQRLTVRDNGSGMSRETLVRIFEPFFTTKPVDEGTGLGLSVVHGIVEGHGGAITVESELGVGTTFSVYLPLSVTQELLPVAERSKETEVAALSAPTSLRLLYLDDDESLAFLVERYLRRRGVQVTVFTEQVAALQALKENPSEFDLVFTDYNMPGMSGLEVTHSVRLISPTLPVVIVSGFVDETLHTEAQSAGVTQVVFKASGVEEFCEVLVRMSKDVRVMTRPWHDTRTVPH